MAKYLATSLAIEKVVSEPRVISSCLPISTISISLVGLESRSTMLPASLAAWVPGVHGHADVGLGQGGGVVGAVAGHGHQVAAGLLGLDAGHLVLGRGLGQEVVDAGLAAMAAAVSGLSPVIMTVRMPMARISANVRAMPGLDRVLQVDDAEHPGALGHHQRGAAVVGDAGRRWASRSAGTGPPCSATQRRTESAAPLRMDRPSHSMPDIRVWAVNGTSSAPGMSDRRQPVALLGQGHDRAAFGGLVGQRRQQRHLGQRRARRRRPPAGTRRPCGCRR